jgi:hypothetical protein
MGQKRFLVLVVKYKEEHSKGVKTLIENMISSMESKYGEVKLVYDGSDERIVTALERVMKLTE